MTASVARRACLLLLVGAGWFGSGCASREGGGGSLETVTSDRTGISLSFLRPAGLTAGPTYRAWTSYEEFSLRGGDDAHPILLSIRFDELGNRQPWQQGASDAAVAAYWRDTFRNPIAETVGTLELAGQPLALRRIRNIDGDILAVDPFVFAGRRISVSFRFERPEDAEKWQARCATFIRSLIVRSKAGVVIWKPSSRVSSAAS